MHRCASPAAARSGILSHVHLWAEPRYRMSELLAVILAAVAAVVIATVGFVPYVVWSVAKLEPCGVEVSNRLPPLALLLFAGWVACALLVPVAVTPGRRYVGWILGCLGACFPLLLLLAGIWAWITPEVTEPSTLFCW